MRMTLVNHRCDITVDSKQIVGRGGEATVFRVRDDRRAVAKLYDRPSRERADKLRAMAAGPPADPASGKGHISIAWPVDLLEDVAGKFGGYVMPVVSDGYSFADVYHPGARHKALPAGFGFRHLLRTAHNLALAVASVHDAGYVIGDLNETNILVQLDARVSLIDCDSFQVGHYRCPVGRPEYTPPELQGVPFDSIDRTPAHDAFGLAVLIHQLLMRGVHPFAGAGEPATLGERIRAGLCQHVPGGPRAPAGALLLGVLPQPLQELFRAAFVDGHANPAARPDAHTWARRLQDAEAELMQCRKDPGHAWFRHLPACPECRANKAKNRRRAGATKVTLGKRPGQHPLPMVGGGPFAGLRYALVLIAAATVAYQLADSWRSSDGSAREQMSNRLARPDWMRTTPRFTSRGAATSHALPQQVTESGSEIYRQIMGRTPDVRVAVAVPVPDIAERPDDPTADARDEANRQLTRDYESASDIYRRLMGTDPY